MSRTDDTMISNYERKVLRFIFGGTQENGTWRRRSNFVLYQSYNESDIVNCMKIQRIKWEVTLSELTKTALLKKSSVLNQLAHDGRAGQSLDGLMD
ncbi:uncharacterized protein TNCV_452151 [Trichonephila clavipes]|nr:uncharacterized protein TNCV_452151 [Trichonephila clavipes]